MLIQLSRVNPYDDVWDNMFSALNIDDIAASDITLPWDCMPQMSPFRFPVAIYQPAILLSNMTLSSVS